MKLSVDKAERLDVYLSFSLKESRSKIKKFIQEGLISLNKEEVRKAGALVEPGDEIEYFNVPDPIQNDPKPLEKIFEDEFFCVLYKEAGMQMYHHQKSMDHTFVEAYDAMGLIREGGEDVLRKGIVHRLDRHTEGLLLVAKSSEAFDALQSLFRERQIKKKYYTLVRGPIYVDFFTIDKAIGFQKSGNKMTVNEARKPKAAITHVKVLKRFGDTKVLLDLEPETGRTHQLRVHLQYYGHPIIGDPHYHKPYPAGKAQLLQAYHLSFLHPFTHQKMCFEMPLSKRLMLK